MLQDISKSDIADLRALLTDAGYVADTLIEVAGSAEPPSPSQLPGMLLRTANPTTLNALLRLFLVGATMHDAEAREVLPHNIVDMCLQTGILTLEDDKLRADIVIVPVQNLLFASDAFHLLGGEQSSDFVLPASTHAGTVLSRLTLRSPAERTLDLGCGCGLHALLAARHSKSVVATDISTKALRYTEFNAMLNNIHNVQCREGSLFGPVVGEKFDRIVSNPPFVVGPGEEFTYRDNEMELDDFCRLIITEAPAYLTEGGLLQMLCEWVAVPDVPWQDRLREWTDDNGCDTWILRFPLSEPADYVSRRTNDIKGARYVPGTSYQDWVSYFEERKVSAIHPGMITLRRRHGDNWFCIHSMPGEPHADIGAEIERNMAANDFTSLCGDDDVLLQAVLSMSPALVLEQRYAREGSTWTDGTSVLRFDGALPMSCEVDLAVLAFLNQMDGTRSVAENIERFEERSGAGAGSLTDQLLPAVRLFMANGFLEAVDS